MLEFAWLGLGVARLTQGGGFGRGLRTVGVSGIAILAGLGSSHQSWPVIVANAIGIITLATLPHGPMLSLPIKADPDGDFIYDKLVNPDHSDEARWWEYSLIRYTGVAAVWSLALLILGAKGWWLPAWGATFIPVLYRALWFFYGKLPTFNRPGDQVENWTELLGWTILGACMTLLG